MGLLEDLRSSLDSYNASLAKERSKVSEYQVKVDAIDELYDELKEKKETMKQHKDEVKTFSDQEYTNWKGDLFSNSYKNKIQDELIGESYEKVIGDIDSNLDALRDKRTSYENKILSSKGVIGSLEAGINSLGNSIAKLFN
jgi:uncharacterized coiled-coil DUF342 family protein